MVEKETHSRFTLAAIDTALEAGDLLRKGFGTNYKISSKTGIHNLVTEYDCKAESLIIDSLKKALPHSSFLAEESGLTGKKEEYVWIIDPLDGTVNFAHRIPIFSVSIALEKQGELIAGVIYQPLQKELFVAEKGKGAFLNGKRIRVSCVESLANSMLAIGLPYNSIDNPFHCIDHCIDVMKLGIPIRRLGSAAMDLAYTAAGYFEGFFEAGLQAWDAAAGTLLIQEAGGTVTHWDGSPFSIHAKKTILATNGKIHQEIGAVLHRRTDLFRN
ncbi:MAG TPA: inositol monophosphatase family protein [Chlamydiales bacterium]|nr:inositol monophosphatase family protein [Chlamydiales bacterium]